MTSLVDRQGIVNEAASAVRVSGLSVRYPGSGGVLALDGLDLNVPAGSFHAILGPSGCGKSTLLKVLTGLLPATEGKCETPGTRRPAYVPQGNSCFPWLTAEDNVAYGLWVLGVGRRERRETARRLLGRLGLGSFARCYPHQLSEGMRQRVAIARAFAVEAPVLAMDEPLSALDFQTRMTVQSELIQLWMDRSTTVIYVTHDIDEALTLADQVTVLSARPGRALRTIRVPFPRPRSYREVRHQPGYAAAFAELLDLIEGGRRP